MSWWTALKDNIGKLGKQESRQPKTLKDRLELEMERLRQDERKAAAEQERQQHLLSTADEREDQRALGTLLRWKLDVSDETPPTQNPAKVDGIWFGVERYPFTTPDSEVEETRWKLYMYRPCEHCRHLIRTIELGDYFEVLEAVRLETLGEDIELEKSTPKLANYLHDMDSGKPDPEWPRACPACKKPLKNGAPPRKKAPGRK